MSAPTQAEKVERIRMALADIGIDPALVGDDATWPLGLIPTDTAWRAREVTKPGKAMCRVCFRAFQLDRSKGRDDCLAFVYMTDDCGVSR